MNHGLTNRDIQTLQDILSRYSKVKKVFLFGSRAIGNYQKGSDIDIAVMNEGVSDKIILQQGCCFCSSREKSTL